MRRFDSGRLLQLSNALVERSIDGRSASCDDARLERLVSVVDSFEDWSVLPSGSAGFYSGCDRGFSSMRQLPARWRKMLADMERLFARLTCEAVGAG